MTKIKVVKDKFHIKLVTPNGAEYALPIELVKGMRSGEIQERYYQAWDFLTQEQPTLEESVAEIKNLYESNV